MSFALARKAIKLYSNPDNPKRVNRRMQRQWMASMEFLGELHILKKTIPRVTEEDNRVLR